MNYKCKCCNITFKHKGKAFFNPDFCSKDCYVKYFANHNVAKNRIKITNEVMFRDGNKCVECGRNDVVLNVHHIDRSQKKGNWKLANNDLENLVTLCTFCHNRIHKGKDIVRDRIEDILRMRKEKFTYKDIGLRFGVSKQRIQQICVNH